MKKLLLVLLSVMFLGSCVTSFKASEIFTIKTKKGNKFKCKVGFVVDKENVKTDQMCSAYIVIEDVLYACSVGMESVDKEIELEQFCEVIVE